MTPPIVGFHGPNRFLSNFWPAQVHLNEQAYASVEHAYQAAKTRSILERMQFQQPITAAQAKRMGRGITLRGDWEQVKLSVMEDLVRQKFTKHEHLQVRLLSTGDAQLVEENYWGDHFWGRCRGTGQNHLGRILMQVREELRGGQ